MKCTANIGVINHRKEYFLKTTLVIGIIFFQSFLVSAESYYKELKVDPKATEELKKPLPELIIFSSAGACVYRNIGFSGESEFFERLDIAFGFAAHASSSSKIESAPNEVSKEKFANDLLNNNPSIGSMPQEVQQQIIDSMYEKVNKVSAPQSCNSKISELASANTILETSGMPFNFNQLLKSNYTVVEYSAEWCVPCRAQESALKKYFKNKKVVVNWLKVERDPEKSSNSLL
jgi:hypothetical protein